MRKHLGHFFLVNSLAFGKFILRRIGHKVGPIIRWDQLEQTTGPLRKTTKEGAKHDLHVIFDHCEWSQYQKDQVWDFSIFELRLRSPVFSVNISFASSKPCPQPSIENHGLV